ncbi:MAG TPA: caspase family protein [Stellaceae bacterium]|nr:caspase family protein [Stellaceae bacterium]
MAAVLCGVLGLVVGAVHAEGEKRVALVVGNGAYQYLPRLDNPANDARLIAATLKSVGFQLIGDGAQTDLDRPSFVHAIREFGAALSDGSIGLFYYAGHGLQLQGINYLVPVGANPQNSADADFELVDAQLVLKQMEAAGSALNMVILDACRNNPFGGRGLRAAGGGLAQMQAPRGTLISYATQPGNVALDGSNGHSPYTAALATAIEKPGTPVLEVFNNVGLAVDRKTGGKQQPWVSSSPLEGMFYFQAPTAKTTETSSSVPSPPPAAAPSSDTEIVFWQTIAQSRNPADFEEYLRQYPNGHFAGLAKTRMAAITPPPTASPPPVPALPPAPNTAPPGSQDFIFPNSDRQMVQASELAALSCPQLSIARNEIYARHGHAFMRADLRAYFSRLSWYRATSPESELNATERENVSSIMRVEGQKGCR